MPLKTENVVESAVKRGDAHFATSGSHKAENLALKAKIERFIELGKEVESLRDRAPRPRSTQEIALTIKAVRTTSRSVDEFVRRIQHGTLGCRLWELANYIEACMDCNLFDEAETRILARRVMNHCRFMNGHQGQEQGDSEMFGFQAYGRCVKVFTTNHCQTCHRFYARDRKKYHFTSSKNCETAMFEAYAYPRVKDIVPCLICFKGFENSVSVCMHYSEEHTPL